MAGCKRKSLYQFYTSNDRRVSLRCIVTVNSGSDSIRMEPFRKCLDLTETLIINLPSRSASIPCHVMNEEDITPRRISLDLHVTSRFTLRFHVHIKTPDRSRQILVIQRLWDIPQLNTLATYKWMDGFLVHPKPDAPAKDSDAPKWHHASTRLWRSRQIEHRRAM